MSKKISQLTTTTTLADTDVLPVVTGMTSTPAGKKIAVSNLKTAVNYHTHANQSALDLVSGTNTGDQSLTGYLTSATAALTYEPIKGADDNFVTDAEKTKLTNLSGTNTGDQTLPVKATGAEITTGTDDAKFATAKALADAGISASGSANGWTTSSDTWTYASASTFTIAGVDRTTTFTKGTRLKFTQTTAKYAVVVASSFSTNTTVTIAVNTDYTIANAAITSPYYSYQASPQGYPGWFAYTPAWTGFSADPTYASSPRFNIIGTTCFTRGVASANGTSNSANMYMTLPAASSQTTSLQNAGRAVDNGSILTSPAMINFTAASNSGVWATQAGAGFTTSGAKSVNWNFEYEI